MKYHQQHQLNQQKVLHNNYIQLGSEVIWLWSQNNSLNIQNWIRSATTTFVSRRINLFGDLIGTGFNRQNNNDTEPTNKI